jgi:rubrerythrin
MHRMESENRPELARVFEQLVAEESGHLDNVAHWSRQVTGREPDLSAIRWDLDPTFDDEGASVVAPERLSAYRAFSIAVRNEERAFAFWTYLAARSPSQDLREAAEQMALEELSHIATLRRERRQAFHRQRAAAATELRHWPLAALEERLAALLDAEGPSGPLSALARARAEALSRAPLGHSPLLDRVEPGGTDTARAVAELLLDAYLDLAERLASQEDRASAQHYATQLLDCITATRAQAADADRSR